MQLLVRFLRSVAHPLHQELNRCPIRSEGLPVGRVFPSIKPAGVSFSLYNGPPCNWRFQPGALPPPTSCFGTFTASHFCMPLAKGVLRGNSLASDCQDTVTKSPPKAGCLTRAEEFDFPRSGCKASQKRLAEMTWAGCCQSIQLVLRNSAESGCKFLPTTSSV